MKIRHKHFTAVAPEPLPLFEPPRYPTVCAKCGTEALGIFGATKHSPGCTLVDPPAQPVDTSLAAAAKIQGHTARIREAVFQYIRVTGGATAGEIATGCGLNPSTVRPRLLELEGRASWAKGKLPARIIRTPERRNGMRIYRAL